MPKITKKQDVREYLNKYVKFGVTNRKPHYGFVTSIEKGIANIRGIEQDRSERSSYHLPIGELRILSHKEVFNLK